MLNEEIESKLFGKLRELSSQTKSFTEIMKELYFEMANLFEENGRNNTRILSQFFQILTHMNLHDVCNEKHSENPCIDSIKYQCDLFFEFMYYRFGDLENLTEIIEESLEKSKKNVNNETDYSKFIGNDNCLMLLKKWFKQGE